MCWRQVDGREWSQITRIVKLTTAVTKNPASCPTWWRKLSSLLADCLLQSTGAPQPSPAEEEISEPYIASTNYTVILIIIIPVLNVWNSSGLDVMDCDHWNCFYQRFVTYLVWRSLKRPVQVTLYNHVLAWCHLISTKDNWMSEVLGTQQCFIVVSVKQHLGGRLVW